jgi:hypothetical protein
MSAASGTWEKGMPDWVATTLSVVAGGALTMFSSWLADHRLTERERERRREERRDRLAARRDDFQRETLLALQTASQKLVRNASQALQHDIASHRKGEKWQKQLLPEGISDDQLSLITETMLLASRIRDDGIRNLSEQLRNKVSIVGESPNENFAKQQMQELMIMQIELVGKIGISVRSLDDVK